MANNVFDRLSSSTYTLGDVASIPYSAVGSHSRRNAVRRYVHINPQAKELQNLTETTGAEGMKFYSELKAEYEDKLCFTTCLDGNFVPGAVGTVRSIRKWYGKDQADIVVFLDKPEPNFDEFCRLNDLEAHVGSRLTALNAGSAPTTPGRGAALPPRLPLRTVRDTFASHGSRISNVRFRTRMS
jgi:hypothetical protein